MCRRPTNASSPPCARGRRHRHRQDQRRRSSAPAPTRATPSTARPAIRSIRMKSAAGSSGGSAVALATGMAPLCTGSDTGGQPAQSRGVLRHRRVPPDARPGAAATSAASAGATCRCSARWRAPSPTPACCCRPSPATMRAIRWPPRCMAAPSAGADDFARPGADRPVAAARRADAGLRLRAHRAPHRRGLRREDRPVPPRLRPRRGHDAGLHRRRRGVRSAARAATSLAAHLEKVRTRPQDVGPNVRANVEEGLRYTAADVARAQTLADRAVSALAGVLPAITT